MLFLVIKSEEKLTSFSFSRSLGSRKGLFLRIPGDDGVEWGVGVGGWSRGVRGNERLALLMLFVRFMFCVGVSGFMGGGDKGVSAAEGEVYAEIAVGGVYAGAAVGPCACGEERVRGCAESGRPAGADATWAREGSSEDSRESRADSCAVSCVCAAGESPEALVETELLACSKRGAKRRSITFPLPVLLNRGATVGGRKREAK
jgi:hypothetical protein